MTTLLVLYLVGVPALGGLAWAGTLDEHRDEIKPGWQMRLILMSVGWPLVLLFALGFVAYIFLFRDSKKG